MFDPEAFGAAMGDLVRSAVEPLEKRIAELEAQLAKAPDLPASVERAVAAAVAALPTPRDGKDGIDGKSVTLDDVRPVLDAAIKSMTEECRGAIDLAIKAIPVPHDGRDGKDGVAGANGADGKDGAPGTDGAKGADGLGLAGAMIDRDDCLVVTMTNGEVKNLGKVAGTNGRDGKDGTNGRDGASFEAFELEYLPESHEVVVKATAAGRTKELRYPAGGIRPAGYWREGTRAKAGEAWTQDGSLFIATKDTQSKPDAKDSDWVMAARRGRDGERGQKGTDGTPPAPIKLGS